MKVKAYALFFILLIFMAVCCNSIYNVSTGTAYVAAAGNQNLYRLNVASSRGTIYDCNLLPLTCVDKVYVAAVAPTIESCAQLDRATKGTQTALLASMLENGRPFKMELSAKLSGELIDCFYINKRYSENQLAPQLIGYLDSEGNGAAGIEKAMDDVLRGSTGAIDVYYHVDAIGRVIAGDDRKIVNTYKESSAGVVLTLDSEIQRFAEKAAQKLGKGSVIVAEVPNCEVRAMVSVPSYSPSNLAQAVNDSDSPLLNRAFCEYSPGSVFKLVTAAREIEQGDYGYRYTCTGSITVDGLEFNCYGGYAHGEVNLHTALQKSCNCYFIHAATNISPQPILSMAYNMGLGTSLEFGRGYYSAKGNLPTAEELLSPRALANFAFGQGNTTVTPIQVTGMLNAIASDGVYTQPKIIFATVNDRLDVTPAASPIIDSSQSIMDSDTAKRLRSYMESTATYGTARSVYSDVYTAGVKTGTAQTGAFENGKELLHFWFCGYVGEPSAPKYTITVMSEYTADDKGKTAAVFKEIAELLESRK